MIEQIGTFVGGEHYLAVMLILILACILTSRSSLSERVNQGSLYDHDRRRRSPVFRGLTG